MSSTSLLILSFPNFQKVQNCSIGKLVSLMDQLFFRQDVGAVIGVALSMMENSQAAVKVEIRNRGAARGSIGEVDRKGMFVPLQKFIDVYREMGNSFV
jgi:hypothetical protein